MIIQELIRLKPIFPLLLLLSLSPRFIRRRRGRSRSRRIRLHSIWSVVYDFIGPPGTNEPILSASENGLRLFVKIH